MKYPKKVEALDRILYFQGISYWRTQETSANSDTLWNPGNFLAIIWQVSHSYLLLYGHIHSILRKNLFHMSLASQNKLIGIVAKYLIQIWLIEEMKQVKCCSISAADVSDVYMCIKLCMYIR